MTRLPPTEGYRSEASPEAWDVTAFGASGDATRDDAPAIQEAIDSATAASVVLAFPAGTYLLGKALTTSGKLTLLGVGDVTLKRTNTSTATSILNSSGALLSCTNITFDGNRSANANPCIDVIVTGPRTRFERCVFMGAKTSAGWGAGLSITSPVASSARHSIIECEAHDNDSQGMIVADARYLTVRDCRVYSNGGNGVDVNNFDLTLADKINDAVIDGNIVVGNTGSGIVVANFYQDNSQTAFDYGHATPDAERVIVKGNVCKDNTTYGIAVRGRDISVVGNICRGNHDGMLFAATYGVASANTCVANTTFGIDAGWSTDSVISGGVLSDNATGLAAGGVKLTIDGVHFSGNTVAAISLRGVEQDASKRSPDLLPSDVSIVGCHISWPSTKIGLKCEDDPIGTMIVGNTFYPPAGTEAEARNALLWIGARTSGKIEANVLSSTWDRVLTMAGAVLPVPDVCDWAVTNTTTQVDSLRYHSSVNVVGTGVAYITMTAGGTGYDPATATVSITGGGGSGATAHPVVYKPTGKIVGVRIDAYGTGYTSAPSVSFGGGGSGATATASLAPDPLTGRRLGIVVLQAQTYKRLGTPVIEDGSAADIAKAASSRIDLQARGGIWYAK